MKSTRQNHVRGKNLSRLEKDGCCTGKKMGKQRRGRSCDFKSVSTVPWSDISHFYGKRGLTSNSFAELDETDISDTVTFGMRQQLEDELMRQAIVFRITRMISLQIIIFFFFLLRHLP
jgi:hypothetical protein